MFPQMPNSLKNTRERATPKKSALQTAIATAIPPPPAALPHFPLSVFPKESHDCSLRSQAPQGRPRRWSDCKQSENAAHKTKTNKRSAGRKEGRQREEGGDGAEVVAGNGSARRCTRTRQACSSVKWVRQPAASSQVPAAFLSATATGLDSSLGGRLG